MLHLKASALKKRTISTFPIRTWANFCSSVVGFKDARSKVCSSSSLIVNFDMNFEISSAMADENSVAAVSEPGGRRFYRGRKNRLPSKGACFYFSNILKAKLTTYLFLEVTLYILY